MDDGDGGGAEEEDDRFVARAAKRNRPTPCTGGLAEDRYVRAEEGAGPEILAGLLPYLPRKCLANVLHMSGKYLVSRKCHRCSQFITCSI